MHVQAQCIDGFSQQELENAKAILVDNQTAFYRLNDIGYKLRENAINLWKKEMVNDGKCTKLEIQDNAIASIVADLENAIDIKNAMSLNDSMHYDTQNDGM